MNKVHAVPSTLSHFTTTGFPASWQDTPHSALLVGHLPERRASRSMSIWRNETARSTTSAEDLHWSCLNIDLVLKDELGSVLAPSSYLLLQVKRFPRKLLVTIKLLAPSIGSGECHSSSCPPPVPFAPSFLSLPSSPDTLTGVNERMDAYRIVSDKSLDPFCMRIQQNLNVSAPCSRF